MGGDKVRVTWQQVKQSGSRPSPRSSCSLITTAPDLALLFGGVFDEVCHVVPGTCSQFEIWDRWIVLSLLLWLNS